MLIDKIRENHYAAAGLEKNVLLIFLWSSENVVHKATIFPMENRKDIEKYWEFLLKIGSRGFIVIDILFLTFL